MPATVVSGTISPFIWHKKHAHIRKVSLKLWDTLTPYMKSTNHPHPLITLRFLIAPLFAAVVLLLGNASEAQPVIANLYPDGAHMFEPSATLSFTVSSAAGIATTNISVQLTVTSLPTGQSFIKSLTAANGLTVGGASLNRSVSVVLSSNTLYSAVIQATDSNNVAASSSVSFDTISGYTFEAEDYDYTSNGVSGLFIDNPQTNLYANLDSTSGVDSQHNGSGQHSYRPNTGSDGLETEGASDQARVQYMSGKTDYDVGYNNGGDFGNYTRHYPAGLYNVYLRGSGGNGPQADAASMTAQGSASLSGTGTGTSPFQFSVAGLGWQTYTWCPLKDSAGNLAQLTVPADGAASTLRVTIDQGNCNENFYLLVPVNTNVPVSTVTITNVYPDGAFQFEATNTLAFTAFSSVPINPASDVSVQLAVTNLMTGQGSLLNLTPANGLTVSGSGNSIAVTAPLASNTIYTAFIQVNDANGIPASSTVTFDTIAPAYTFEGEDFNYGSGNFFDNPQTNAYSGFDGSAEVDFHNNTSGSSGNVNYNRYGLPGENANDVPRANHIGESDYDLGNTSGGNWGNYTRTYPAGVYNIFVRASRGNSGTVTDSGNISLVTSDRTQPGQTLQQLGTFNVPSTGNWQKYAWEPVMNAGGTLARFVADGTVRTLRLTFDNAGDNVNYVMLMPADLSVNPPPYVSGFEPDGSSMFLPTNKLAFVVNSSVGIASSNILLNLNGVNVSGLTVSGSSTAWNVTYPVKTNVFYTAIVTLTDSAGTSKYTNSFSTFASSDYQWEAEDYDYNGGSFADNPQVNAYAGQAGTSGVDMLESDPNGPGRGNSYRPANGADFPDTASGDQTRSQFNGQTDYSVGSFGPGSWAKYTRHYPAGTYNVVGRFAEGAAPTEATLSLLTSGFGTSGQTVSGLGTFYIAMGGWSSWEWSTLVDGSGRPVSITLSGAQTTLQLGGSPISTQPEANVNFFMLVPVTPSPTLTAVATGGNVNVSFLTQSGYSYQVQYKAHLSDANWTSLGTALSGNGSVQSVSEPANGSSGYYRVMVQ